MTSIGASLAADTRGVDALRAAASRDPKAAIQAAARQFEALFMHELLKSMRAATQSSGLLDNGATQLGTEMLDTQFAGMMSGLRGGLSDAIAKHLERQLGAAFIGADREDGSAVAAPQGAPPALHAAPVPVSSVSPQRVPAAGETPVLQRELGAAQAAFVSEHLAASRAAQDMTGIPAHFMLAQAAHESGWGRREIRNADGSASHNLFGIKAGADWKGAVAQVTTTEVIDGEARKGQAKFRAYASYAEAFADYARLLSANPRYRAVVEQGGTAQGFAGELQRAGYATDPHYADKLTRTINTTLRVQRALT